VARALKHYNHISHLSTSPDLHTPIVTTLLQVNKYQLASDALLRVLSRHQEPLDNKIWSLLWQAIEEGGRNISAETIHQLLRVLRPSTSQCLTTSTGAGFANESPTASRHTHFSSVMEGHWLERCPEVIQWLSTLWIPQRTSSLLRHRAIILALYRRAKLPRLRLLAVNHDEFSLVWMTALLEKIDPLVYTRREIWELCLDVWGAFDRQSSMLPIPVLQAFAASFLRLATRGNCSDLYNACIVFIDHHRLLNIGVNGDSYTSEVSQLVVAYARAACYFRACPIFNVIELVPRWTPTQVLDVYIQDCARRRDSSMLSHLYAISTQRNISLSSSSLQMVALKSTSKDLFLMLQRESFLSFDCDLKAIFQRSCAMIYDRKVDTVSPDVARNLAYLLLHPQCQQQALNARHSMQHILKVLASSNAGHTVIEYLACDSNRSLLDKKLALRLLSIFLRQRCYILACRLFGLLPDENMRKHLGPTFQRQMLLAGAHRLSRWINRVNRNRCVARYPPSIQFNPRRKVEANLNLYMIFAVQGKHRAALRLYRTMVKYDMISQETNTLCGNLLLGRILKTGKSKNAQRLKKFLWIWR
jgi:hypothetical protein